jgi:phage-related protein
MTTFTYTPNYGAAAARAPRTKSVKYGDGYELRSTDGINMQPEMWDLQFTNRTSAEALAIDAFLTTQAAVSKFQWTTPTGVTGNFICRTWNLSLTWGNVYTVSARFEQVFES